MGLFSRLHQLLDLGPVESKKSRSPRRLSRRIERLETRVLLASDFGDAPLPYPTTLAEGGAEHVVMPGSPALGTLVDTEADGVHSAAADADGADEDGVTFGTIQVGAINGMVTVNVQAAAGKLNAWIDFNGDGSWGGPGEQIVDSRNVALGNNNLTFDIPAFSVAGTTFARLRLSTAGGLGVSGQAADGEVEDYQVTIASSQAAGGSFLGQNVIGINENADLGLFPVDLVLSAGSTSFDFNVFPEIAWYENDGNQVFARQVITSGAGRFTVAVADLDGDGDLDVLSASF